MKRNNLVFVILLCFYLAAQANSTKDTIKITCPTYFSEFERKNFENYLQSKKTDILALSLGVDSTTNQSNEKEYLETIKYYLGSNRSIIDKTTNEKSKINKLFKTANHSFFIQYDLNAYCSKFYSEGKFNCVTGSLFFSLIMDSLNIPYTIKEKPTHVFLLAYPSTFSLPIESTDPNMKIFIPDEGFKKRYVDFLADSKLILKSEIASKGVEAIFNEKYYSNKDIKPIELVGLLYFNSGVNYLDDSNFKCAFQQFEKAYLLYPSERIRYVLEVSLLAFVGDMGSFSLDHLDFLAKLANYSKNKTYHEMVTDQFKNYTQKYLINENNEAQYEQIYNRIISQVEDSTVKSDISTVYYHERSRVCSIKDDNEGSWKFISQGYKINPKNMDLKARLQSNFITKLNSLPSNENFLIRYDSLLNEFPVLRNSVDIQRYEGAYYLNKAGLLFYQDNTTAGEKLMKKFDAFSVKNPNCKFNSDFISKVYCEIASAYYRKKDINKCKLAIERGLVLAPKNELLIRKYKMDITHEIK